MAFFILAINRSLLMQTLRAAFVRVCVVLSQPFIKNGTFLLIASAAQQGRSKKRLVYHGKQKLESLFFSSWSFLTSGWSEGGGAFMKHSNLRLIFSIVLLPVHFLSKVRRVFFPLCLQQVSHKRVLFRSIPPSPPPFPASFVRKEAAIYDKKSSWINAFTEYYFPLRSFSLQLSL